jgi:hypothetical protein
MSIIRSLQRPWQAQVKSPKANIEATRKPNLKFPSPRNPSSTRPLFFGLGVYLGRTYLGTYGYTSLFFFLIHLVTTWAHTRGLRVFLPLPTYLISLPFDTLKLSFIFISIAVAPFIRGPSVFSKSSWNGSSHNVQDGIRRTHGEPAAGVYCRDDASYPDG